MAVNQTGNQFVAPNLPSDPDELVRWQALIRFLNTQVVNEITNPSSSVPVLGRQGTGIVTTGGGTIDEITSDDGSVDITDPNGPTTDLSVHSLLFLTRAIQSSHPVGLAPLSLNFVLPSAVSLFFIGRVGGGEVNMGIQFNGDTGSNYAWQSITNNAGTLTAAVNNSDTSINSILLAGAAPPATQFSGWIAYADPTGFEAGIFYPQINLQWSTLGAGVIPSASGQLSGTWMSTATISSFQFITLPTNGGFNYGSHIELYYLLSE